MAARRSCGHPAGLPAPHTGENAAAFPPGAPGSSAAPLSAPPPPCDTSTRPPSAHGTSLTDHRLPARLTDLVHIQQIDADITPARQRPDDRPQGPGCPPA